MKNRKKQTLYYNGTEEERDAIMSYIDAVRAGEEITIDKGDVVRLILLQLPGSITPQEMRQDILTSGKI